MAWRSSGKTNDEMVDKLKRFGVISSEAIEASFRRVDRKFFVPKNRLDMAYADQPLREGSIHISAPHIYGSVLEALELRPNMPVSFLNAGSGTGYLTCISAMVLGPRSRHYCVEINEDVVKHCHDSILEWKEATPSAQENKNIRIIFGNALDINFDAGECIVGFDRIYIGAAVSAEELMKFKRLLKPSGILVGPVEDELVKVVRNQTSTVSRTAVVPEFRQQVLSSVRFTPLLSYPTIATTIPALVWKPSVHHYFPDSFRQSCKAVLLCSRSEFRQPSKPRPASGVNVAAMLPPVLWLEILSFAHCDWFQAPQSELEFLRRRLKEEQANAEKANLARLEAETRCHLAERERDIYKLLARRWKARLSSEESRQSTSPGRTTDDGDESAVMGVDWGSSNQEPSGMSDSDDGSNGDVSEYFDWEHDQGSYAVAASTLPQAGSQRLTVQISQGGV